jgi:hypothetical protein
LTRRVLFALPVSFVCALLVASSASAYQSVFTLVREKAFNHPRLNARGKPILTSPRIKGRHKAVAHTSVITSGCTEVGYMWSADTGLFVSTELSYGEPDWAVLRARASSVGAWEEYQVCTYQGAEEIWSNAAERWVSAEDGSSGNDYGMLRARSTGIGAWERFYFTDYYNGGALPMAFESLYNGRWVSDEEGFTGIWYGMLRARSESIGPWEEWDTYKL